MLMRPISQPCTTLYPAIGLLHAGQLSPGSVACCVHRPVHMCVCMVLGDCAGNTQAVLVHQLSKHTTQNPFRKNRGRVVRVLFHPLKPFLFVATQNHVRVYNLAQQALAKKLIGGSGSITSMAIHPGGNHVIVGSEVNHQIVCVKVML